MKTQSYFAAIRQAGHTLKAHGMNPLVSTGAEFIDVNSLADTPTQARKRARAYGRMVSFGKVQHNREHPVIGVAHVEIRTIDVSYDGKK